MKELVDLYAKLLIGTFTFIGPAFTLLISLFQDEFERLTIRFEKRKETWSKTGSTPSTVAKEMEEFTKQEKRLNPKIQVKRVYGSLLSSIAFIAFYYFQHTHYWERFNHEWIRITTICISIALFSICLIILRIVFGTIIDAKKSEAREKAQEEALNKLTTLQTIKN